MDEFYIKYNTKEVTIRLLNCLRSLYDITTDYTGTLYIDFTLRWNYIRCIVCLSMPRYIEKALHRFCVSLPSEPQHSPHQWLTFTLVVDSFCISLIQKKMRFIN